jgi:hypothetical protein
MSKTVHHGSSWFIMVHQLRGDGTWLIVPARLSKADVPLE